MKPVKKAKRSTTSWMIPKPGDVLNFAYLWHYQARQGVEEGLKDRPSVVVLAVNHHAGNPVITVCPVTSQKPDKLTDYIAIPQRVKAHLGLIDRDHSYIMTTEVNRFTWPGPDLRPLEIKGRVDVVYGRIPEHLLDAVKESMITNIERHKLKQISRD